MLMVVLGAGASYDSVDPNIAGSQVDTTWKPPLADELFATRFRSFIDRFPAVTPIVPELRALAPDESLEMKMEELHAAAAEYPPLLSQLAAARFYLQAVIGTCGNSWHSAANGTTNYVRLLTYLDRWRHRHDERVLIVTFNYDAMVERALSIVPGRPINSLGDYIAWEDYRFVKLHGSVDWYHQATFKGGVLDGHEEVSPQASPDG
jgi:hypothetical protein